MIEGIVQKITPSLSDHEKKELVVQLAGCINYLILHDFNKLIQLLYAIDVNESKLKKILNENKQTDASELIADLLLERQLEKLKIKQEYKPPEDIQEEDKW
jgi:hypothetical protein